MQDIDFDEIDRAVNSIANNNVPARVSIVEPTAPSEAAVSSAPSPAVRRSSGRFMDVVHPSSDMRPSLLNRSAAPSAPSLHREEVPERKEVSEAHRSEPAVVASAAFHWPEPLETIEASLPEPVASVAEEPPFVAELEDEKGDDEVSPLESPFLSDAKVEKRPLGAFSGADADLPLLEDPIPFSSTNFSLEEVAPDAAPEVVELAHEEHEDLPHELNDELLKLEGDGWEEPLLEATNPPDPIPVVVAQNIPTGPTSITQQYTEQASTTTAVSGAIFDTEAYHQALTQPVKKRSSLLIFVWILTLILVGGGIGTALYFIVFPMIR